MLFLYILAGYWVCCGALAAVIDQSDRPLSLNVSALGILVGLLLGPVALVLVLAAILRGAGK